MKGMDKMQNGCSGISLRFLLILCIINEQDTPIRAGRIEAAHRTGDREIEEAGKCIGTNRVRKE
jgi:hypothetical protein